MPSRVAKKPQIMIVGLLPGQHQVLIVALGRHLSLRFAGTRTARKVGRASSVDRVYIMTRFAKHGMTENLQTQFDCVTLHRGGISQLIQRIAADFSVPFGQAP